MQVGEKDGRRDKRIRAELANGIVCSYIAGVSKLQQATCEQGDAEEESKKPGPPNRPDHDVQVEQFLRKQYHSKSGDGMPDPDAKD